MPDDIFLIGGFSFGFESRILICQLSTNQKLTINAKSTCVRWWASNIWKTHRAAGREMFERWQREAQIIFWDREEIPSGAHCSNALLTKTFRLDWLQPVNNSILIKVKKINEEWEPDGRCVDLCRHQERRWLRPRSEVCSLWQQDHNYWSFDYFLKMIPNYHDDDDANLRTALARQTSCRWPELKLLPPSFSSVARDISSPK